MDTTSVGCVLACWNREMPRCAFGHCIDPPLPWMVFAGWTSMSGLSRSMLGWKMKRRSCSEAGWSCQIYLYIYIYVWYIIWFICISFHSVPPNTYCNSRNHVQHFLWTPALIQTGQDGWTWHRKIQCQTRSPFHATKRTAILGSANGSNTKARNQTRNEDWTIGWYHLIPLKSTQFPVSKKLAGFPVAVRLKRVSSSPGRGGSCRHFRTLACQQWNDLRLKKVNHGYSHRSQATKNEAIYIYIL